MSERTRPELVPLKRALGERISDLRKRLGVEEQPLSTARLAARIAARLGYKTPISSSTILRWERGEGTIEPWELIELARLARTTVEQFVYPAPADAELPPQVVKESFPDPDAK